jgi:short-subunit dehydrogenase
MELQGKRVLVVGASGVFGSLLVQELLAHGAEVHATASTLESADRIPLGVTQRLVLDLANQASIDATAAYINQSYPLDGVILASGRVGFGTADATSAGELAALDQINYRGPASLISQLVSNLTAQPKSFVLAINGVVAEKVFPAMAAYSASKTALSVWLSTLRLEQRRNGLTVIEARPGHTETGLAGRALFGTAPAMPQGMTPESVVGKLMAAIVAETPLLTSEDFA